MTYNGKIERDELGTWVKLNNYVVKIDSVEELEKLLADEQAGRNRPTFKARIVSRINHLVGRARLAKARETS